MTKKIEFTERARDQIKKIINEDQLLSFISRVAWNQNASSAFKIIETSSFAAKHLNVSVADDLTYSVSLVDSVIFGHVQQITH